MEYGEKAGKIQLGGKVIIESGDKAEVVISSGVWLVSLSLFFSYPTLHVHFFL